MNTKGPILIVEDDEEDQLILRETFGDLQIKKELIFFDDCTLAFNFLMSTPIPPFLIISDINLPRMNGIEFKKKIDQVDYLRMKSIPFIFFTTSDAEKSVEDAYQNTSVQGYFQKGNSLDDIKKKLRIILTYWTESLHP